MLKLSTKLIPVLMCMFVLLLSQKLHAQLKANFTTYVDSGCTQLYDTFTNTSTGGTLPYTYYWSLGNTIHATTENSNGIFNTLGIIDIKFKVTDADDKTDSITKSIKVKGAPIADHSTQRNCSIVLYTASIDSTSPTPIDSFLFVGEGAPGYGPIYAKVRKFTYKFITGGNYHYTLKVTGANGCITTYNDSQYIPPLPKIVLPEDTTVCSNSSVTIKAEILNSSKRYWINWGTDPPFITGTTITSTIIKDTSLVVTYMDDIGCSDYESISIKIFPLSNSDWRANYSGNATVFHAIDSTLPFTAYNWNFGDGDSANGHSPSHQFLKDTAYPVRLKITDTNGCISEHDSLLITPVSGIEPNKADILAVSINPNPFENIMTMNFSEPIYSSSLQFYNMIGQQCKAITATVINSTKVEISTENLTPGIYFVNYLTCSGIKGMVKVCKMGD